MGRKAKFDVKSLKIGEKLPFPKNKEKYIYQYLNNFHRSTGWEFVWIKEESGTFIKRVA